MLAERSAACALALLLSGASTLQATDTTFVSQGARVKVFPLGAKPVAGEVAKLSYDTLVILPEGNGVGLALGFAAQEICDYGCESYPAVGAALGTAFGFGVGAGIGALNTSGERWTEAELPAPTPVALNVGKDGSLRLAFSLRL